MAFSILVVDGSALAHDDTEIIYEAANILIGTCLAFVFEQLDCTLTYSAPRLIGAISRSGSWCTGL